MSQDFKNMNRHARHAGPLHCSGQPNAPETESQRWAFERMQQENQHLKNMVKQMQAEKVQLEEKNRELEASNKHLGEIVHSQPNLEIINEGWEKHLKRAQDRIIELMEYRQQKDTQLIEMSKSLYNLQETNKELQCQLRALEKEHEKKSQQLQSKHFMTETSGGRKAEHKKTLFNWQEMEANRLEEEYRRKKCLQVKTDQELQRTKLMEEKEQLEAELSKMEIKVQELEETHKETQLKLRESEEKNERVQLKLDQVLEENKQGEKMQREMQHALQDSERRNTELQVFHNEVEEKNVQMEAEKVELEKRIQELEDLHRKVQKSNEEMHEAKNIQEGKYGELKEKHAEEHKKLEQLDEKCKKLEEDNAENICAIKNLIVQNKDLQEYYLKKKRKPRWFFRKHSAAPPAQPGQK